MKYSYIGIMATLAFLPISLVLNINYVLPVLVAYYLWLLFTGKNGHTFVIMAFAMCIAYTPGLDYAMSGQMADMFVWVYRSVYFCLLVGAIYINVKRKYYKSGIIIVSSILYIFVNSVYGISDFISSLYKLLIIPLFFNVCYAERMNMDELTKIVTVLFVGLGGYAMLDFFFETGPYLHIYKVSALYDTEGFHRANGILGNSLSLSAVAAGFFVILLIKWYLQKEADLENLSFCMMMFVATGSRTSIVVAIAVIIVFLLYIQRNVGKVVQVGVFVSAGLLVFFTLAYHFLPEHLEIMFGRLDDSSEHRMAGYQTAWNIFSNNFFGVGSEGFETALLRNASYGFMTNLTTLDNFYLTQLAKYGVFCILILPFFLCYPYIAFRKSIKNKLYRIIVFWFFPWVMLGFSFAVDSYISVTLLYFGIAGHLFRIIEQENLYGSFHHRSQLQHA